ncbi:MAG: hypothetical protein SVR94_15875 [Pseudomonadota bacterium]|nr:hypothetical protein [Pseudomonadota bacterium]
MGQLWYRSRRNTKAHKNRDQMLRLCQLPARVIFTLSCGGTLDFSS